MKTIKVLTIGLVVSATTIACSPSQGEHLAIDGSLSGKKISSGLDFQKIERDYLVCLSSRNSGIVESALGHVIYMRIAFPKEDFREVQTRLFDLASRGYTRAIRYKAYVALHVFADPQAFVKALESKDVKSDEFFADLVSRFE